MLFWLAMVLPILSDDRLIGRLTKFSPFQAFISRSPFFVTTCKICAKLAARGETMEEDILPFCSTLIHPFVKFVLYIISAAFHLKNRIFPVLMSDYIIEGNTQAAAQGNSWQDGVNALVMLYPATL